MFGKNMTKKWMISQGMGALFALFSTIGVAFAGSGQPSPWQIGLQDAATPVAESIHDFHYLLMVIITVITLFVLALLVYIVLKFGEKKNPVPSKTTHHALLEVVWTVVPVLILVIIAIPSFRLLKYQLVIPQSDLTIKVTGKQWYWTFEYAKDSGGISFDSIMLSDQDIAKAVSKGAAKDSLPRLLAVDNEVVVPVNKVVRLQVTAADVIHSFAMQSFGVKIDAMPGRLNESWFKATKEGIYYGQCSELCGKDHAFMPAAIRVVSQDKYEAWLKDAQKKFATNAAPTVQVAGDVTAR